MPERRDPWPHGKAGSRILADASSGMTISLHARERRRHHDRAGDVGHDRTVALALGAGRDPGRVGLERGPLLLALGQRFPGQEVVQILVAVADEHGPEAGLPDAVLLPDLGRVVLEALEQRRQAAGHAAIDAILVDHGRSPRWTTGRSSSAAAVGTSRVAPVRGA